MTTDNIFMSKSEAWFWDISYGYAIIFICFPMVVSSMMPPLGIYISINNQCTTIHNSATTIMVCYICSCTCACACVCFCVCFLFVLVFYCNLYLKQTNIIFAKKSCVCNVLVQYTTLCGSRVGGSSQCINIIFAPLTRIYPENYWGTPFLHRTTHSDALSRNWCNNSVQCIILHNRILRSFYITVQQFRMDKCTVLLCGFSAQCSECALRRASLGSANP